jgi:hypothetical protein
LAKSEFEFQKYLLKNHKARRLLQAPGFSIQKAE